MSSMTKINDKVLYSTNTNNMFLSTLQNVYSLKKMNARTKKTSGVAGP